VIDPIDLVFLKNGRQLAVQLASGIQIMSKRLLDNDPAPAAVFFAQ
jgi:hypothetical protein